MEKQLQKKLLKTKTEKLYTMFSSLQKKVRISEKKNKNIYHKMSDIFTVFGYKLRLEANKLGFKDGAKVRVKETHELPMNLRNRRKKGLDWKWYDTSGVREISCMFASQNTGFPNIDSEKPELIVNLHPPVRHKSGNAALPLIIRLSDIELIKSKK